MKTPSLLESDIQPNVVVYKRKPVYEIIKRIFDIFASLFALLVLGVPMLIVALVIMLTDFGNPFFTQYRVGKNGKLFKIYKFRTMIKNAEELRYSEDVVGLNEMDGPNFKIKDDPRLLRSGKRFPVGKILRKLSIDELPQLINILKGDMSVVGPRPFVESEQADRRKERSAAGKTDRT